MSRSRIDRATPSLIEPPVLRHALVATFAPLAPIDKTYSFLVPDELAARLQPGMRVEVPFGRSGRPQVAFCVDLSQQEWASSLKTIISVVDETPMIGPKLLELGRWLSRYYCSFLGHTLDMMIPAAAKAQAGRRRVKYVRLAEETARTPGEGKRASAKQQAVADHLRREGRVEIGRLCALAGCTPAVVSGLEKKGLVIVEVVMEEVSPVEANPSPHHPDFELSDDQQAAIASIGESIKSGTFSVQVLFGVTGSGKTEVYVSAIRQVLAAGRQAIMLVPEIALTTQTVRRLQTRFERVAVLHSGLSGVQRSRAWSAIARGDIPVVIGTRSAVFAPCPSLGVIIVDEEAEPSYKNLASPRYHTRDVAIQRANLEGIPVVLGSATPSLETWKNAHQRKHYQLLRMPTRVRGLAMPQVYLVDMRQEHHERPGVHMLSRAMEDHLNATLDRKEQAVLLLNRRGYAGYLHCPKCKYVYSCPHCDVHMVFHASTGLAHCHYCHQRVEMPKFCPMSNCDGRLARFGIGTQRVEEELGFKFPKARVRRMDSDAMQKNEDYADILAAFERREFDFLVGTQMIAKGLDFPFVSFVGIVSADTALGLNDFRSEERTFQLVLQVAGRSGRGDAPGHVVVQTFAADADPIRHAVAGNYEAFADGELQKRRRAKLPPWTRMMRVIIADPLYTKLQKAGDALKQEMEAALARRGIAASVFGPSPCPIKRLRDSYRMDIQLTFETAGAMLSAIDLFKSEGTLKSSVKTLTVDVDPVSLQ